MADAADPDGHYDLTALGWLLFERLCTGWLEHLVGVDPGWWVGSADRHRHVVLEGGLPGAALRDQLPGHPSWSPPGRIGS